VYVLGVYIMSRSEYDMPYDAINVDYLMDSLQYFAPERLVRVWFQGKLYYVEEVDCEGFYPELVIGKEIEE
jgi:lipoprotein NlpI